MIKINNIFLKIKTVYKIFHQAFGKYKLQIIVLMILGFISSVLEGIGVNALIPLFSFIAGQKNTSDDFISRSIKKLFEYFGVQFSLKYILIFICLIFVFKVIALAVFNYIRALITTGYERNTRSDLFRKTINSNFAYLTKQKIGYLENVLMFDIRQSAIILNRIGAIIMALFSLSIYSLVAINISPYITLITLLVGLILFLMIKPIMYRMRIISRKIAALNKQIAHFVNESIKGVKEIKIMNVEQEAAGKGEEHFQQLRDLKMKNKIFISFADYLIQPVSIIFICIVFAISYKMPGFSFAALIAVIYLIQKIFSFLQRLQGSFVKINQLFPHLRSVLTYEEKANLNQVRETGKHNFKFERSLEFKNVYFSYEDNPVLSGVNFILKKGEIVGLVGESGAGKTTIVDLILRLYTPTKGKILLDNANISQIDINQWKKNIGYVPQDIFLKNDTIINNIKFYNNSLSDEEVIKALKMVNAYDFIAKTSRGLKTVIGDDGKFLSGGQRQRIAMARILAKNPKILILDEATSALDDKSEIEIQNTILNFKRKMTIFIIAHRLSTLMNCDKLLILENGKIKKEVLPSELLKDKEILSKTLINK